MTDTASIMSTYGRETKLQHTSRVCKETRKKNDECDRNRTRADLEPKAVRHYSK